MQHNVWRRSAQLAIIDMTATHGTMEALRAILVDFGPRACATRQVAIFGCC